MAGLKIYDNVVVRRAVPQWERPPVHLRVVEMDRERKLSPCGGIALAVVLGAAMWVGIFVGGASLLDRSSPHAQTFTPVTVTYEPPAEAFKQTMVIVPHVQRPTDGLPAKCDLSEGCTGAVLFY